MNEVRDTLNQPAAVEKLTEAGLKEAIRSLSSGSVQLLQFRQLAGHSGLTMVELPSLTGSVVMIPSGRLIPHTFHNARLPYAEKAAAKYTEMITKHSRRLDQKEGEVAAQIRQLALAIAKKIVGKELEFNPDAVVEMAVSEIVADK